MAVTNLKKVQMGKESTWGTAVTASSLLAGVSESSLEIVDTVLHVKEQGRMDPSDLIAETAIHAEASVDLDLTYEDILYPLEGAFGALTAPSGTTGAYVWAYNAPTNAAPTPRPYTIEYGMSGGPYAASGSVVNKFSVKGDVDGDGIWQASVGFLCKSAVATTMQTPSARSTELIRMADTVLYIDTWAGTAGSTTAASTLISFNLELDPKTHLKTFGGSLTPATWGVDQWEGTLETVVEYNATAKALVDVLAAASPVKVQRQIQLKATSTAKIALFTFAGTLVDGAKLFEDRDGNATVGLKWEGTYNSTLGNWHKWSITNAVATLP